MKTLIFTASLTFFTTMASIEGKYTISEAEALNGLPYTGSVEISKMRESKMISWKTSAGNYTGVGIEKGSKLYAGYGINIDYGVVVYEMKADNSLEGVWTTNKSGGMLGTEKVIGGKALNGTYEITGTNAGSNTPYRGTLTIKNTGKTYQLFWKTGTISYTGTGILEGTTLAVAWGFGRDYGFVKYDFKGNEAKGIWTIAGNSTMGVENLKK